MVTMVDRMAHGILRNRRHFVPRPSLLGTTIAAVDNLVTTLLDWQERARQRRQLLAFDDAALKDFGRNSADAVREADKPCWRA